MAKARCAGALVPFGPLRCAIMDVVAPAVPPDSIVAHAARPAPCDIYWLRGVQLAIRREPPRRDDTLKLVAATQGSVRVRQHGHQAVLERGAFVWVEADRPFELACDRDALHLQIRWPRASLLQRYPDLDVRAAVVRGHEHPGERIIGSLLESLSNEGRNLSEEGMDAAAGTLLQALGIARRRTTEALLAERVLRARNDVERLLHQAELTPLQLAERQGVSRRYLDGLLEARAGETLATLIRRRRLERAAEQLRARTVAPIEAVAQLCGFRNASHFSRVFRAHFRCSPTDYRTSNAARR
jgi:AraC family transcriptional activator of tynA and feaB